MRIERADSQFFNFALMTSQFVVLYLVIPLTMLRADAAARWAADSLDWNGIVLIVGVIFPYQVIRI